MVGLGPWQRDQGDPPYPFCAGEGQGRPIFRAYTNDVVQCRRTFRPRARARTDLFLPARHVYRRRRSEDPAPGDRQSVVWGKRVSVRVDLGGRGIIEKKNMKTQSIWKSHKENRRK